MYWFNYLVLRDLVKVNLDIKYLCNNMSFVVFFKYFKIGVNLNRSKIFKLSKIYVI